MSKANQAFKQNDEAVSPVIGVILMVAITVVLAAVVFVLVSNLGKGTEAAENASASLQSPSSGVIQITLVKAGDSAPYTYAAGASHYTVAINGSECDSDDGLPASIDAGSVIRIDATDANNGSDDGACEGLAAFVAGAQDVAVTVTVAGSTILSSTVDVHS